MEGITLEDKTFSMWAKKMCTQHPEILKHMKQSHDALERAIAVRIMKLGGI
jgi:hypothetical protein